MQFLRVPAPFPSTVISLSPEEEFTYRGHTIQSVTVDPLSPTHPYTLSGLSRIRRNHQSFGVPTLPAAASPLLHTQAAQELARFATPAPAPAPAPAQAPRPDRPEYLRAVPAPPPQRQHLADPSGPAAAPGTLPPPRSPAALPAPRQHLAAATPPPAPAHSSAHTPGRHRA